MPHRAPVHLRLGPSRRLAGLFAVLCGGGAVCLWLSAIPATGALAGSLVLLALGLRTIRVHALRAAPEAVIALACRTDGPWLLERRDGRRARMWPTPAWTVHPALVIVPLRGAPGGPACVVIAGDACDADTLRRLRVLLRTAT